MAHPGGRPRKFNSVAEMEEAIEEYFFKCDARTTPTPIKDIGVIDVPNPEPYTIQGLAVHIGLTTEGMLEYEKRPEFSSTVKEAKARVEANKVVNMLDGKGFGAGYIFDLKHNHGWKDKQEVEHSGGVGVTISEQGRAFVDRIAKRLGIETTAETPEETSS